MHEPEPDNAFLGTRQFELLRNGPRFPLDGIIKNMILFARSVFTLVILMWAIPSFAPNTYGTVELRGLDGAVRTIVPTMVMPDDLPSSNLHPYEQIVQNLRIQVINEGGGLAGGGGVSALSNSGGLEEIRSLTEQVEKMRKLYIEFREMQRHVPVNYPRYEKPLEPEHLLGEHIRVYEESLRTTRANAKFYRENAAKTSSSESQREQNAKAAEYEREADEYVRVLANLKAQQSLMRRFPAEVEVSVDRLFVLGAKNMASDRAAVYSPKFVEAIQARMKAKPEVARQVIDAMTVGREQTRSLLLGGTQAVHVFSEAIRNNPGAPIQISRVIWQPSRKYPLSELPALNRLIQAAALQRAAFPDMRFAGVAGDDTATQIARLPNALQVAAQQAEAPGPRGLQKPGYRDHASEYCPPGSLEALRPR